MLQQQQNIGRRFGTSKMHFSTPVAVVWSKAVVLLLLIRCCKGFCNCSIFCYFMSILVLRSSWWGWERAGCFAYFVFLVSRDYCVAIPVDAMGFVCSLWLCYSQSYSLTILGCHSCEQRWLWRVCTFAWSSLSLRHSSKFSCGGSNDDWMPFCASSEGSDKSHICTGLP